MSLYTSYNEDELIQLLKANDSEAFQEIYNRYWDKLLYVAGKKMASLSEAENILQDVFLDLWKRRSELQINKSLEGYLAVAIKYRIINYMARRERHHTFLKTQDPGISGSADPHDDLAFSELKQWLEKNVSKLPEKCRLAYQLREIGFSQKQIADHMSISEKTVEQHISKALRTLRTSLSQFLNFFL